MKPNIKKGYTIYMFVCIWHIQSYCSRSMMKDWLNLCVHNHFLLILIGIRDGTNWKKKPYTQAHNILHIVFRARIVYFYIFFVSFGRSWFIPSKYIGLCDFFFCLMYGFRTVYGTNHFWRYEKKKEHGIFMTMDLPKANFSIYG